MGQLQRARIAAAVVLFLSGAGVRAQTAKTPQPAAPAAQESGAKDAAGAGEVPLDPGAGAHDSLTQLEGGGSEDAAPEGLVSRASGHPDHPRTLGEIKKSGYLRVLTRNNDTSFFIYRGHRMGFDYEVGKRLAQRLGIRVDMVITNGWDEMIPALLKGEGDVIAAEFTVSDERSKQVLFSEPWAKTSEVVVFHDGAPKIAAPEDLAGKEVHVRKGSSYVETLAALNQRLEAAGKAPMRISLLPASLETEGVLQQVSKGEILYTLADSLLADIHASYFPDLVVGPQVGEEHEVAWAVRPRDTDLKDEIDGLLKDLRKKPDFNLMKRKYFEAHRDFQKEHKDRFFAAETGTLSPFDALVRRYSEQHGFDWRLVAAQIYQESHFDPQRKSWVGAQGLFQVMPATARGLGIADPTDPEQSIRGGLKYMEQLNKHYADVPDRIERYRFALAAYNSGFGHVDDARALARAQGKDVTIWRNVAPFLLKLADKRVAAQTRFGYCRGFEPVDYVRHIDERYAGYAQLVQEKTAK